MAAGDHDAARRCGRYAERRPGSSTQAATRGATARLRRCAAWASPSTTSTGRCETFSGGELTRASLARALAGDPDLLLLDEPTNHLDVENLEWLEQELQSLDAAVILVAHDRWFLEAVTTGVLELEAGRSTLLPRAVARVADREGGARPAAAKAAERVGADIARLERFVERFRYKKTKAKQAQAKLTQIGGSMPSAAPRPASSSCSRAAASHSASTSSSRRAAAAPCSRPRTSRSPQARSSCSQRATFALERGEHVGLVGPNGSGKTTLLETVLGRHEAAGGRARLGHGVVPAYFSQHEVELDERGSVLDCAQTRDRPVAAAGAEPARPVPLLRAGRRTRSRSRRCRAGSGGGWPSRSSSRAVRTSSCSTSRRTTSTSRAARRWRKRSTRSRERCCSSPTTGRCSTRSRTGRSRSRTSRCVPSTAAGPSTPAAAKSRRPRRPSPHRARRSRNRGRRAHRARTSSSSSKAASRNRSRRSLHSSASSPTDWSDVETLAAHRRAREELQGLISRWERLFEEAQA